MPSDAMPGFTLACEADLGLQRIANSGGLSVGILPNGAIFAIEYGEGDPRIMLNQVLGSPVHGGIGRLILRVRGMEQRTIALTGPDAQVEFGVGEDRVVWAGVTGGVRHRVSLRLDPTRPVWLWRVDVKADGPATCDVLLVQDIGLASRNFLMNNEAYGSQYTDHHIAQDPDLGAVVMSRQNLAQGGRYPWLAQGCLNGAVSFATDALQLFGPAFRDFAALDPEGDLAGLRLQHEAACVAIQSRPFSLDQGVHGSCTFFAVFDPDHAAASSDADLKIVAQARGAATDFRNDDIDLARRVRSLIQDGPPLVAHDLPADEIAKLYPERVYEEMRDGALLSFFTPDGPHNRHVVTRAKEHLLPRRHGTLMRTGQAMLPDEVTLCATGWMHGVFAAQLTIGNTSFHKLFSVSRDPYNITRASGLRMLAEIDGAWRLLATPSLFEMGLSDGRWIYRTGTRTIVVHGTASGDDPAIQWRVIVEGPPCRFLVYGHLVLGEREYEHAGRVEIDRASKRIAMRPDPSSLWGMHYPHAIYHLVTPTLGEIEEIGGNELLLRGEVAEVGTHIVLRTHATNDFAFAVTGSLNDVSEAERLADKYAAGITEEQMLAPAAAFWSRVTGDLSFGESNDPHLAAIRTTLPWFAHNAIIHLTVPHGLEQYTGAAWGVRDVCQGPVEFLLSLRHDEPVREILRIVFAEQYEARGSWPQWFMVKPYAHIRDHHAHGDVIVWPLKALCDYVEETNDFSILDEEIAWRRDAGFAVTSRHDTIAEHVRVLIDTVKSRFIPRTHLICYGEGDWNDSLQPADPALRDCMVSTWTCVLLWQQLRRYAEVLRRGGRDGAPALDDLADTMGADIRRHLIRDGVIAGYAIFGDAGEPELLLHPSDRRTGLKYSLLPMTRAIIAGQFTDEEAARHLQLIREHLLYPDGARLMDQPVAYKGGVETIFRRAESAAFFGREIGLMYSHAHLRYGEALAKLGEDNALWTVLAAINPISVTDDLPHASLRQRNAFFSSSDAAFPDRYAASAEWEKVKSGHIPVDGGWRIYSSGPGLYANILIRHAFGRRRWFGEEICSPVLPAALRGLRVNTNSV